MTNIASELARSLRATSRVAAANKLRFGGLLVVLLLIQSYALRSALTSSTTVSRTQAIEQFREAKAQAQAKPAEGPAVVETEVSGETTVPTNPSGAGITKVRPVNPVPVAGCDWSCPSSFIPPVEGVFPYFHCARSAGQCTGTADPQAHEAVAGVERPIPKEGDRTITSTSGNSWSNRHRYSEEHIEWFEMSVEPDAVFNHRYMVEMEFGGIPDKMDIRQVPPMPLVKFPITLDQSWTGSWKDPNKTADGTYSVRVAGKEELKIGNEVIRTWKIVTTSELLGPRTFGRADLTLWYSAERNLFVQEYNDQDVRDNNNITYKAKWMATIASLKPES